MANVRSMMTDLRAADGLVWSPGLFDDGEVGFSADLAGVRRRELGDGAWVEHLPGWLRGSARVFEALVAGIDWDQGQVPMYGELVEQPRLTAWFEPVASAPVLSELLEDLGATLAERYDAAFCTVGLNLYRDGRDSVAWHGDRVARDRAEATIAIVSVGAGRAFRLRPTRGGSSLGFELGGGDLLVMGGTCQRTWQHAVPKVVRAGPRISITFRHRFADGAATPPPALLPGMTNGPGGPASPAG